MVERPARRPGQDEVEVAVNDVAICGSDQAPFEGRMPSGRPVAFGHEFSGRVSGAGAGVMGFEIGQTVVVAPLIRKVMPFNRLGERQGAVVMDAARQVVRLLIEFDGTLEKRGASLSGVSVRPR